MKRRMSFVLSSLLVVAFVLTACGTKPAATVAAPAATTAPKFTCALITPNPLGDRSFIDAAARGIDRANKELPVKCDIIETNGVAEHETALRGAIQKGYDMIEGLAMDADMFTKLATEFPNQKFGSPSEIFLEKLPANLAAYTINVHESSFLAGLIVGSLTKSKIVGAVVGGDSPALNQFFYGYKQGVMEVCKDCKVLVSYLGFNFADPTLGKETAISQYDQGADIIYAIAGRSGEGVLASAAEKGKWAIGVDSNQDDTYPGSVIVSMMKRTEATTYLLVQSVVNGTFKGGFNQLGMADGAAGLSWDDGSKTFETKGPADMVAKLSAIKELVAKYRADILSGKYVVCNAQTDPKLETPACAPLK
jgi:basic membrane protein A and related proteins